MTTEKQQQFIECYHFCGMTRIKTAGNLGNSLKAVKARLIGAMKALMNMAKAKY